jgi:hypothetical protein
MVEFLASVIGALAAGALSKAGDVGGRAVTDAYNALRALIVRKLGKGGAVQSLEDEQNKAWRMSQAPRRRRRHSRRHSQKLVSWPTPN